MRCCLEGVPLKADRRLDVLQKSFSRCQRLSPIRYPPRCAILSRKPSRRNRPIFINRCGNGGGLPRSHAVWNLRARPVSRLLLRTPSHRRRLWIPGAAVLVLAILVFALVYRGRPQSAAKRIAAVPALASCGRAVSRRASHRYGGLRHLTRRESVGVRRLSGWEGLLMDPIL